MAKNTNKTGNTPQSKTGERGRKKSDTSNSGSPKSGASSDTLNQKSEQDTENRFNDEGDVKSPKGSASRIDDDDDMDMPARRR